MGCVHSSCTLYPLNSLFVSCVWWPTARKGAGRCDCCTDASRIHDAAGPGQEGSYGMNCHNAQSEYGTLLACAHRTGLCLLPCSVRAAYHPSSFESSLARHKEDAAAAAQQLAADIRDGRYDPARPDFNQGQLDPAADAAGGQTGSSSVRRNDLARQPAVNARFQLWAAACVVQMQGMLRAARAHYTAAKPCGG